MDRSIRTGVLGLGIGVLLGFPIHLVVDAQQPQQGRARGMAFTEPSPIDPNRLRCVNCCIDLNRKPA